MNKALMMETQCPRCSTVGFLTKVTQSINGLSCTAHMQCGKCYETWGAPL